MVVKVVTFIIFVLAGECLSLPDERDHQVDMLLEKIYEEIIGFEKRLTSIDKRVSRLENSQTPMDTSLAYRSLRQNQDPCSPNPCKHRGTCVDNKIAGIHGFTCVCADGWAGVLCDIFVDSE